MEYTPDNTARIAKQKEIEALLTIFSEAHTELDSTKRKKLMEGFVSVTTPLDPPLVMEMMVMSRMGRGGTKSRKPGNIRLNWRKLLELVPDVTLAGAGAAGQQWLIPFAALYIWMKLCNTATIEIEEKDAFVLYSLWTHRNHENKIPEDEAFSKSEALAKTCGLPFSRKAFDEAVNRLLSLECIEMNEGIIWLREWIIVRY